MPASKHVLLTAILAMLAVSGAAYEQTSANVSLSAEALQQRGHDLRRDIIAAYKRLRAAGMLQGAHRNNPDLTPMLLKYIPLGLSLNDAEAILRAAGFRVGHGADENHPALSAQLILNTHSFWGFSGYFLDVDVNEKTPSDHTDVRELHADIDTRGLEDL